MVLVTIWLFNTIVMVMVATIAATISAKKTIQVTTLTTEASLVTTIAIAVMNKCIRRIVTHFCLCMVQLKLQVCLSPSSSNFAPPNSLLFTNLLILILLVFRRIFRLFLLLSIFQTKKKVYFFFGLAVCLFQLAFLILFVLSVLHKNFSSKGDVDSKLFLFWQLYYLAKQTNIIYCTRTN